MIKTNSFRKRFYCGMATLFVLSGLAVSGVFMTMSNPRLAYSQAPEPQCVCAECGRPCGSGHARGCSSRR